MIGSFFWIVWNIGLHAVDKTITNGIQHRLMIGHGIYNAVRVFGTRKPDLGGECCRQIAIPVGAFQAMQRIRPIMNGTGFAGKQSMRSHDMQVLFY